MPNRGDRVQFIGTDRVYQGNTATVTHFCGDPGYDEADEEATDVWVMWDNPSINACWVECSDLQVL